MTNMCVRLLLLTEFTGETPSNISLNTFMPSIFVEMRKICRSLCIFRLDGVPTKTTQGDASAGGKVTIFDAFNPFLYMVFLWLCHDEFLFRELVHVKIPMLCKISIVQRRVLYKTEIAKKRNVMNKS